jgi:hypothetical protein
MNQEAINQEAVSQGVDWLAWQYLLNDLDATATAEFENRLAEDEVAAVALATAVRLRQAIAVSRDADWSHAVCRQDAVRNGAPLPVGPARKTRGVAAMLAAVAAVVLLAVIVGGQSARTNGRSKRAADLVRLWTASAPDLAIVGEESVVEEAGVSVDEVPEWLLTAVVLDRERRAAEAAGRVDASADEDVLNDLL